MMHLTMMIPFLLMALVQAWAPIQTTPTNLPKVLEFAEKAWVLPKANDLSARIPHKLSDETQHRMLPWTHQHDESIGTTNSLHKIAISKSRLNDDDRFFFDGYSGATTEWPTRQALLASIHPTKKSPTGALKMMPQDQALLEYFYDDMGALSSWAVPAATSKTTPKNDCQHHFFDVLTGKSICWSSVVSAAKSMANVPKPRGSSLHDFIADCDTSTDAVCWVGQ